MQNDPQFPFLSFGLTGLGTLEDAFHRAHAHARATAARGTGCAPTPPHGAVGAQSVCPVSHASSSGEGHDATDEALLDGRELLRAVREPLEWLLTLAHRLAAGDSEEIAAIDRLRAAFHSRLAGNAIGIRMRDLLIAFALLVGALDADIVHEGVTRTIADGVSTLLTYEGVSLAAQLARIANSLPSVIHAREPRHRRGRTQRSTPL
ncbi:MAG: hypothetical protein ACREBE_09245 [bacterium]